MKRQADYKGQSSADLRAMRDVKQQNVPSGEAARREHSLLKNFGSAQDDLQWIVDNSAWRDLGFETFTAWYSAKVLPEVKKAGLRPTPEFALYVLEKVFADEAQLPKQQRRLQIEMAELVQVSPSRLRRMLQDPPQVQNDAGADLGTAPTDPPAAEPNDQVALVAGQPGPQNPADEMSAHWARERLAELRGEAPMPKLTKPVKNAPTDHLADYLNGTSVWCRTFVEGDSTVVGVKMATCQPCLQALMNSVPAPSEAGTAPADHPLDPDGPEEPPGVANDRPGMNVDAAVEPSLPAGPPPVGELGGGDGAGSGQADAAPSGVESGVAAPDSGVEGVAVAGPPFTDPASTFMGDWRRFVRLAVGADTEVVGPMLTEAEFSELYGDLELLREQVKKLQRHA